MGHWGRCPQTPAARRRAALRAAPLGAGPPSRGPLRSVVLRGGRAGHLATGGVPLPATLLRVGWPTLLWIPGFNRDPQLITGVDVWSVDLVFLRSGGLACLVEVEEPNKTAGTAQERAPGFSLHPGRPYRGRSFFSALATARPAIATQMRSN